MIVLRALLTSMPLALAEPPDEGDVERHLQRYLVHRELHPPTFFDYAPNACEASSSGSAPPELHGLDTGAPIGALAEAWNRSHPRQLEVTHRDDYSIVVVRGLQPDCRTLLDYTSPLFREVPAGSYENASGLGTILGDGVEAVPDGHRPNVPARVWTSRGAADAADVLFYGLASSPNTVRHATAVIRTMGPRRTVEDVLWVVDLAEGMDVDESVGPTELQALRMRRNILTARDRRQASYDGVDKQELAEEQRRSWAGLLRDEAAYTARTGVVLPYQVTGLKKPPAPIPPSSD